MPIGVDHEDRYGLSAAFSFLRNNEMPIGVDYNLDSSDYRSLFINRRNMKQIKVMSLWSSQLTAIDFPVESLRKTQSLYTKVSEARSSAKIRLFLQGGLRSPGKVG